MKKRILLSALAIGFISLSYISGPATHGWDCTGAETACTAPYTNYTGCSTPSGGCHSSSATTTVSVNIELDSAGVPISQYVGGNTYTVKLSGTNGTGTAFPSFGFELTSIKGIASAATVSDAGTWSTILPPYTAVAPPYGTYTYLHIVEHNTAIALVNDTFSRSFTWTAPAAGTGKISFWAAVNFVNGVDASPSISSDLWNTNHIVIGERGNSTTAISNATNNVSIKAYPNPVTDNLNLQIDNPETGAYSLYVLDMLGRTVISQNIEMNGINNLSNISTSNWLPGTYQVVVERNGNRQAIPIIKM